jgi:hypothetical protein
VLACGVALAFADGCTRRVLGIGADEGDGGGSTETSAGPATEPPLEAEGPPPGQCSAEDLGAMVPTSVEASTASWTATAGGSCGGDLAPERFYSWSAPHDGTFTFDTLDGGYDTVLYVRAGACDGPELACNDDAEASLGSAIALPLSAGDEVAVAVDGFDLNSGPFTLWVDRVIEECPTDLIAPSVPVVEQGTLVGRANSGGLSCGGGFGSDATYVWVAPQDGAYRVSLAAEYASWVFGVWAGDCSGEELGCRSSGTGGFPYIDLALGGGESLVVQVDGVGHQLGDFTLSIDAIDVGECPEIELGSELPVSTAGTLVGATPTTNGSCAVEGDGADVAYAWTAPTDGVFAIDTIGSGFDTVVYVLEGGCFGGVELACDDDGGGDLTSRVEVALAAGDAVMIVVDGFGGEVGDYLLHIE